MTELVRGIARNVRGFARPPQQQGDGPVVLEVNGRTVRLDMPAAQCPWPIRDGDDVIVAGDVRADALVGYAYKDVTQGYLSSASYRADAVQARCFGSVNIANTSSRGASYARVPTIAHGSVSRSRLLLAAMSPTPGFAWFLRLKPFQIVAEAVEAFVVETPIMIEPRVDFPKRTRLDAAGSQLRFARARDQAGTLQDLQVLRDRR